MWRVATGNEVCVLPIVLAMPETLPGVPSDARPEALGGSGQLRAVHRRRAPS